MSAAAADTSNPKTRPENSLNDSSPGHRSPLKSVTTGCSEICRFGCPIQWAFKGPTHDALLALVRVPRPLLQLSPNSSLARFGPQYTPAAFLLAALTPPSWYSARVRNAFCRTGDSARAFWEARTAARVGL